MLQNDTAFNVVSDMAMKLGVTLVIRKNHLHFVYIFASSHIEMKIGKTF